MRSNKKDLIMKDLLKYLKNYRVRAILAPLFKLLEASFELLVPLVMAAIIDKGIGGGDKAYIFKMGALMIALGVVGLVCSVTAQYFSARTAMGFGRELRADLFGHITSLSYTEIDKLGASTLITRMTNDVNQLQTGVNMFLRLFLRSPFIVFGACIMAFTVDVKAALIFVIALPVLVIIVFGIMFKSIPLYKKVQGRLDTVLLKSRESLSGARVIRAFNREEAEESGFAEAASELAHQQLFVGRISAFLNPLTYVVINLSIAALVWFGGKQVDLGILKQGGVYALVNYMSQILVELVKLANLIIIEMKTIASANRVAEVFAVKSSMEFAPDEMTNRLDEFRSDNQPFISFKNAGLTYKGSVAPSLRGINLEVKRGETVGIIGGTGSGKTTLVNLIPRFYDCTEGSVEIAGRPVADYGMDELRGSIGIVPQKAVLFSGTIADNLRLADSSASDEELSSALMTAQAADFVSEKPGGINYFIEQKGRNLSGGQRQRLTIARALIGHPQVLILDDSSSALDYATDARLRSAIREASEELTVFIVSQRTASIMHADKILVLDDGEQVGLGTHEELLESCEVYREIHLSQDTGNERREAFA